jgi:hypothetical protein
MNNKLVIVVFFLLMTCFAYSQNKSSVPEWAFGFNGGVTFSNVSFNSAIRVPQESLQQYSGGFTVRFISENHFGIQGELNFSQRGWKEKTDSVHLSRQTRSLNYIEFPLMTHIYFGMGKKAHLIFNIGPQISWFIREKTTDTEIHSSEDIPPYYNQKVQRRFDYGLKGSMGLEFKTGVGSFILDGRYYFGLSDIFNNTRADIFQASPNKVIGVNLTYLFRLK